MKTVEIQIQGTSPMLQHRFGESAELGGKKASRAMLLQIGTPREEAEKVVYRDTEGLIYFPSSWITGTIREAGSGHKMKGSRKSAKYIVPAAVRAVEVDIPLLNGEGKTRVRDFEVDSRPVTIPATKGRVMRHRPRFDVWSATFNLTINDNLLPEEFVHQLLNEAGEQYGIGDYRPGKSGSFGCFRVTHWTLQ